MGHPASEDECRSPIASGKGVVPTPFPLFACARQGGSRRNFSSCVRATSVDFRSGIRVWRFVFGVRLQTSDTRHVRVCAGSAPEGEGDRKLLARWHRRRIQKLGRGAMRPMICCRSVTWPSSFGNVVSAQWEGYEISFLNLVRFFHRFHSPGGPRGRLPLHRQACRTFG